MRTWIEEQGFATANELDVFENDSINHVKNAQKEAWQAYITPIKQEVANAVSILTELANQGVESALLNDIAAQLQQISEPLRRDIGNAFHKALRGCATIPADKKQSLVAALHAFETLNGDRYSSHVYSQGPGSVFNVPEVPAQYTDEIVDGYQVVRACFDANLERDPRVFAFGEDVGKIGDVNQGFSGMQEKYGELRVTDKGIREWSIIGEGIGAAMRGLRPIAEIQYLDYLLYALEPMSDDIATMQYRTKGGQKSPIIIRTRGHRLEGIWHSGSPMGMIIHAVRGMHVCVPRNMTQAAGMYNTLLRSDEPALVVECLNGYRIKEKMPTNIGEFTVPLGVPEVLKFGEDITLVTYGSCVRIAQEAIELLANHGVRVELIDVQTLLPFDINHTIVEHLKSTNRIAFLDEDVPGGATSYMMQQVLEVQGGYKYLDAQPLTIAAKEHRPAYGSDGDYFSKPSVDSVFEALYSMMHEANPNKYPSLR
jgi:pyruvate/2-oxoglutarate/acetoin dehydrogenase E1 component